MTMRVVTPAGGTSQVTVNWDNGGSVLTAGQVLDVPAGGALESAIGLGNLTALSGSALANDVAGLDPSTLS